MSGKGNKAGPEECIGTRIEKAGKPQCRIELDAWQTTCFTCGAVWRSEDWLLNGPQKCMLQLDPLRGGVLS